MKRISERPFLPKPPGTESQYISTMMRCMTNVLGEIAQRLNAMLPKDGSEGIQEYVKTALPDATVSRGLIYVTNETGGFTLAFSDGTNWRRVQDRNIVS